MRDFFTRYAERIAVTPAGCWEWTWSRTPSGYGHFTFDGQSLYAHRAAYEFLHGVGSAAGVVVRHRCDNPPCCRPDHLLGGTHADNSRDMWERGRGNPACGEDVHTAKLTEADVIDIRRMAAAGMPVARIADLYPVGHTNITAVALGQTWRHLPGAVAALTKAPTPGAKPGQGAKYLNADKVREIKSRLAAGEAGRALAAEFGVSPVTISAVKVGRIWGHVQ